MDNLLKSAVVQKVVGSFAGGVGGALAGLAVNSLLGKESSPAAAEPVAAPAVNVPSPPTPESPAEVPQPNSAAVMQAKKKSIATMQKRRGRASTILTDQPSDALGG